MYSYAPHVFGVNLWEPRFFRCDFRNYENLSVSDYRKRGGPQSSSVESRRESRSETLNLETKVSRSVDSLERYDAAQYVLEARFAFGLRGD